MTGSLLPVSVVAGSRRLDLAVPPALPVAELVPGLARRLGVVSYDGLRLCTVTGSILEDGTGLASQDVAAGSVLVLAPPPPPAEVHDDPAEALAVVGPPAGTRRRPRTWPLVIGGALLLLAAAPLAVAAEARTAAVVALVLLAASLALGRLHPATAVVTAFAASAHGAVAAAFLADGLRPDGAGVAWAAVGGAVLAVTSLAMAGLASHRLRLLPAVVVAAAAALVGAVLSFRAVPLGALGGVILGVAALATAALPWVVVGRITRPRGRVDVEALAAEVRTAHDLLIGSSTGLAVVHLGLAPVVAWHGPVGMALVGCASTLVLVRARHLRSPLEALPGLVAGCLGLLVVVAVGLAQHQTWRPVGAVVLAGAGGLVLAQAGGSRHGSDRGAALLVPLLLRALETACLVALVPLLVLAGGALETRW